MTEENIPQENEEQLEPQAEATGTEAQNDDTAENSVEETQPTATSGAAAAKAIAERVK